MFEAVGTMCTKKARGGKKQGLLGSSAPWGRESEAAGGLLSTDWQGPQRNPRRGGGRLRERQGDEGCSELVLPEPVGVSHPLWSLREPALGPLPVPAPSGCPQPGASP